MTKKISIIELAKGLTFAPSSNVAKLLKNKKVTEEAVAKAALTTKTYKTDKEFAAAVDSYLAGLIANTKPAAESIDAEKPKDTRGSEPRR